MLLEFRISNFRSIGEEQIISFLPAAKQKEYPSNILVSGKHEALNILAFYGANGCGKSNLFLAMRHMHNLVQMSALFSSTTKLPYDPFLLRTGWAMKPTSFEITFLSDGKRFRYGIEFKQEEFSKEWLYRKEVGREVPLFLRENEEIETFSSLKTNSKILDAAIESTKRNSLFLSACDVFNVDDAKTIMKWFSYFSIINGLETEEKMPETLTFWGNEANQQKIEQFLYRLNLGFTGIEVRAKDFEIGDLPTHMDDQFKTLLVQKLDGMKELSVWATHRLYDKNGKPTDQKISWKARDHESAGTNNILHLSGPVLWTLINGGVLVVDEIEAKMHSHLTLDLIEIFLNKETNPNNSQLIFATHDTNLLTYSNLRRDQIYFVEKNDWESTEIYSLSDFRYLNRKDQKERPDSDKEKRYLEGRYGAIPLFKSKSIIQKVVSNGEKR